MILQLSQSTGRGLNVGAQRNVKIKQDRLGKLSTRTNHESEYSSPGIKKLVCIPSYPLKDLLSLGDLFRGRGTARAVPQSNCHHHHHYLLPNYPRKTLTSGCGCATQSGTHATVSQLIPHSHLSTLLLSTSGIPRISLLTPQHSSCNHLDTSQQSQYSLQNALCQ